MRAIRRLLTLRRMGIHERWRVAMMSDPDLSGEVYCHCQRCERDYRTYVANGGPISLTRYPRGTRDA